MRQTAIEWFVDNLKPIYLDIEQYKFVIQLALEMEKKQHGETYSKGWTTRERFDDLVPDIIYPEGLDYEEKQEYAFEQYYQQNYGK